MTTFVSLITQTPQWIPPHTYVAVRFEGESTDSVDWHPVTDLGHPDSALIIPTSTAVGLVAGAVFFENPRNLIAAPTQYQFRITRDPYDPELIDSTATHDRAPTPGAQFEAFTWPMKIRAGQPLALMVAHNGSSDLAVTLAEFKVWVP